MIESLAGKRVLVTGATGFIGGRLVERLVLEENARVRALVRSFARAPRIARFDLEMVSGDILDRQATVRAVQGCEVVFHCAWGNRRVNVEGTRNILDAALSAKVERVVHLSTMMVYGETPDGDLSESAPRQRTGDEYGDSKLEGEELVLSYHREHGLLVVVLQPTVVYGPWAPATTNTLSQLKTGKVILVNGGDGFSNAVYVDDVVTAMLLATANRSAVGEVFIISGESPTPWRDFFGAYEDILGRKATVNYSWETLSRLQRESQRAMGTVAQVRDALRRHPEIARGIVRLPALSAPYKLARKVLPESFWTAVRGWAIADSDGSSSGSDRQEVIHPLSVKQARFYARKTRFRHDKARSMLGYEPKYSLEAGMELTEQWARWAGLLE